MKAILFDVDNTVKTQGENVSNSEIPLLSVNPTLFALN